MALPPPKCGEIGVFYTVFERSELSAAERHTTHARPAVKTHEKRQPLGRKLREVLVIVLQDYRILMLM